MVRSLGLAGFRFPYFAGFGFPVKRGMVRCFRCWPHPYWFCTPTPLDDYDVHMTMMITMMSGGLVSAYSPFEVRFLYLRVFLASPQFR